ncbi:Ctr copper transporter family protein [Colletotrichum higginsianum IMI 349063]|uniref:Ctr copper transporter family protein n=1 Tax=Colletotrichum higginsianum (strain IMI 349063) TaxID=759273 RepID=A0A1B7YWE1_COLHI|nr:Ctr copper transporter family protein [Colletotrichum higginsianum IMI 349063]OBR16359.1 Ctr copper transporter family protein [Colletotrichum higginsianum IMI 349063]
MMVNLISLALPLAFATITVARNLTVDVSITSKNGVYNISAPETNVDVTNIMIGLSTQSNDFSADYFVGYANVSGTYQLALTYCEPDSGPGRVLQILTHGVGFDRSYWDFPANGYNYSYVAPVVDDHGYSTFSWDRVGIAESTHGDPINEIQGWLEVAALKALTDKLRAGTIPEVGSTFDKIVHVGHSLGSIHTYALTAAYPDISDGIILTGFAPNVTFITALLLGGAFVQASDYAEGYFAVSYEGAMQICFFAPGYFDPAILRLAYESSSPVTVGELFTIGGEIGQLSAFAKPAFVIAGERDLIFCGGDCYATGIPELLSLPAALRVLLQGATPFEAAVVNNTGHGLTLLRSTIADRWLLQGYSHVEVTSKIQEFLSENGLANKASCS